MIDELLFAFHAKKKECIHVLHDCKNMLAVISSIVLDGAEWIGAKYLISENRHFLKLNAKEFKVLSAKQFLSRFRLTE